MHFFGQVLNIVVSTVALLSTLAKGNSQEIIFGIVAYPIFMLFFACMIRVVSEVAISVLLVPSLLAKVNSGNGAAGGQSVNGGDNNADLTAYGVGISDDGGTIV